MTVLASHFSLSVHLVVVPVHNFKSCACARIMGVNPAKIPYLKRAAGLFGPVGEDEIEQRGELIKAVRTDFKLVAEIPAHRGLRL